MVRSVQQQEALDTIAVLADQIARTAPECGELAMRIVELASELVADTDWATVHDAIEAEAAGTDMSGSDINQVTDAVMRAVRPEKK